MRKFKKGDRVVMVGEESSVRKGSKGTVLRVAEVGWSNVFVYWDNVVDSTVKGQFNRFGHGWWVNHNNIRFDHEYLIVMRYDGKKTTAIEKVDGKVVAKAEANRNPSDPDSPSIGFKLAFSRLIYEFKKVDEDKKKNMNPKFSIDDIHIGDLIKLRDDLEVGNSYSGVVLFHDMMKNHDFMKVEKNDGGLFYAGGYWYSPEMISEVYHPASC